MVMHTEESPQRKQGSFVPLLALRALRRLDVSIWTASSVTPHSITPFLGNRFELGLDFHKDVDELRIELTDRSVFDDLQRVLM